MRKIGRGLAGFLAAAILGGLPCSAAVPARLNPRERALLIRAIASSYPEEPYAAKVGMAAVVLRRMGKDGTTLAETVESLTAEGAFPEADRIAAAVDEDLYRITAKAADDALAGADPTFGALTFRPLRPAAEHSYDLRFDDRREDGIRSEKLAADCTTVIGGVGFR